MKTETLIQLGLVGGVAYLIYKLVGVAGMAGKAVGSLTLPASNAIANLWVSLTASPPMGGVPGNILFPDGTGAPLSTYSIKTDAAGNVYVLNNGAVYQLSPSDADGDWPATLVVGA